MDDQLSIFDALDRIHGDSLTDDEGRVLRLLEGHRGRQAAITGETMAESLGMEYNAVRATVAHLIAHHDELIASMPGKPAGYFIPETPEEVEAATRSLRNRGISILARAAKMQRTSLEEVYGQAKLEREASGK